MDKLTPEELGPKIYMGVGEWKGDKIELRDFRFEDEGIPPPNRTLLRATKYYGKDRRVWDSDRVVLAVYDKSELSKDDLLTICRHNWDEAIIEDTGEKVPMFDFPHNHFLETVRKHKLQYLEAEKLLDLDDGSIFGTVKKTWTVPEHTIVVPEYEEESYVKWDCWNDGWKTTGSDYYICNCGTRHYRDM